MKTIDRLPLIGITKVPFTFQFNTQEANKLFLDLATEGTHFSKLVNLKLVNLICAPFQMVAYDSLRSSNLVMSKEDDSSEDLIKCIESKNLVINLSEIFESPFFSHYLNWEHFGLSDHNLNDSSILKLYSDFDQHSYKFLSSHAHADSFEARVSIPFKNFNIIDNYVKDRIKLLLIDKLNICDISDINSISIFTYNPFLYEHLPMIVNEVLEQIFKVDCDKIYHNLHFITYNLDCIKDFRKIVKLNLNEPKGYFYDYLSLKQQYFKVEDSVYLRGIHRKINHFDHFLSSSYFSWDEFEHCFGIYGISHNYFKRYQEKVRSLYEEYTSLDVIKHVAAFTNVDPNKLSIMTEFINTDDSNVLNASNQVIYNNDVKSKVIISKSTITSLNFRNKNVDSMDNILLAYPMLSSYNPALIGYWIDKGESNYLKNLIYSLNYYITSHLTIIK